MVFSSFCGAAYSGQGFKSLLQPISARVTAAVPRRGYSLEACQSCFELLLVTHCPRAGTSTGTFTNNPEPGTGVYRNRVSSPHQPRTRAYLRSRSRTCFRSLRPEWTCTVKTFDLRSGCFNSLSSLLGGRRYNGPPLVCTTFEYNYYT